MARLRVFVSSTYYDLKHIRSSLELMIEAMGYEAVLFERGDVAYNPDTPLDESCYAEILNSDIVLLIIGGRYGTAASHDQSKSNERSKDDRQTKFDSITKSEHDSARKRGIPIYTLIEKPVYAEFQTYKKNKNIPNISYAHVESANVFRFIEGIEQLASGNAIFPFERFSEIESWLKDQWSGLFRDLLKQRGKQQELAELASQVDTLTGVSKTLEAYMENVLTKLEPENARVIINRESARRSEETAVQMMLKDELVQFLRRNFEVLPSQLISWLRESKTYKTFVKRLRESSPERFMEMESIFSNPSFFEDLNATRRSFALPEYGGLEFSRYLSTGRHVRFFDMDDSDEAPAKQLPEAEE